MHFSSVVVEEPEEEEEDTSPNLEPEPPAKDVEPPNSPPDLEEESSIIDITSAPSPKKRGRPCKKNSKHRRLDKKAKVVLERVRLKIYSRSVVIFYFLT